MIELVQDDERLREERKKAKKNKEKYVGLDSETAMHNSRYTSSAYSDHSGRSGGFTKSTSMNHALDDKDWRSNNPTIQERINDITSKVKTMFDVPDIENNKTGISDDENDGRKTEQQQASNASSFKHPTRIDPIAVKKKEPSKSKTVDNISKLNIKFNEKKVIL